MPGDDEKNILQFDNEITVPGCDENGHAGGHAEGDADFVLQADQVLHLLFCTCVYIYATLAPIVGHHALHI